MSRTIKKVAVLGSGIMGSRIACHFANAGVEVLLLDIVPKEPTDKEKAKNLTLSDKVVRNRIVNDALTSTLKSKPSPIYSKKFINRISTGNLDDDLAKISEADWIIEAVIENLNIKKQLFENVEKHRKPGTIISTNTSGIPVKSMLDGRSDDFKKHFCGTHFFNPPRYLQLLEIIPSDSTDPSIIDFLMNYGTVMLGKKTVLCKDTPAFIANRIGVFSIMSIFHLINETGLSVQDMDALTGTVIGRPKSATFRTCDVVGLDTLVRVANGLVDNCPEDEAIDMFKLPDYITKMVENDMLGSKSGQGFYKKVKEDGKKSILSLNLKTLEYEKSDKKKFDVIKKARETDSLAERHKILANDEGEIGAFFRKSFAGLFAYVANRIPEISDEVYRIDDAVKAGFGWRLGPFEIWDAVGFQDGLGWIKEHGFSIPKWIDDMASASSSSFYATENNQLAVFDPQKKVFSTISGTEHVLKLSALKDKVIWENSGVTITDLGDKIINVEFHTKMNTLGADVVMGINKALDLAEESYHGLVMYNDGDNFTAGANVGMIFMMAVEQDFDELNLAVKTFQDTVMRLRYSSIPVVLAPHNLALGGGCEMSMHADKVVAHAETYMGLVEFGVGVIPGGAGTKEFALRTSDEFHDGDIRINTLRNRFLTIGQAKVSTSAVEAFELGYLRHGVDEIVMSRELHLNAAKEAALQLWEQGYAPPVKRNDILVLGNEGLGIVYAGANSMRSGNYISDHDQLISEELGYVLCGGDLSEPTKVSEDYLLKLEREKFVGLCQTRKTLERLESLVKNGKILRN